MGRRKQNKPKRACHDTVQSQSTSSSAPSGEGQHPNSQRKRCARQGSTLMLLLLLSNAQHGAFY
eukprot:627482-Pelagomonas_calceolata.AAC.1